MVSSARRFGQYPHMQDVADPRAPVPRAQPARGPRRAPACDGPGGRDHRRLAGARGRTRCAARSTSAAGRATCASTSGPRPCSPRTASCTPPIARARTSCAGCRTSTGVRLDHAKAAARELLQAHGRLAAGAARRVRSAIARAAPARCRAPARHPRAARVASSADWGAEQRPLLARQLADLEQLIAAAGVVCIAGGHVAVLLNRLRLFGLGARAAHPAGGRLVGRRDGAGRARRAVPRSSAAGRRQRGAVRGGPRPRAAAPCSCRTPRRGSRLAIRSASRCSRGAWHPRSATRSTTATRCTGVAAGSPTAAGSQRLTRSGRFVPAGAGA